MMTMTIHSAVAVSGLPSLLSALALAAALLAPLQPRAQTATPPPAAASAAAPDQPAALPPCWPSTFGGSGTALQSGATERAVWYGWWCPRLPDDWAAWVVAAGNGYVLRHPDKVPSSFVDALAAYWRLNVRTSADAATTAALQAAWRTLQASRPAVPAPQPALKWVVEGSPFQNIRTNSYAGGVLGPQTASDYVQSGSSCDCAAFSVPITTASRWCAVVVAKSLAARCVPKP